MNDETRTRFLASIAKQLPADRVAEVHIFSAIRQGGSESGVAVVAVDRDVSLPVAEAAVIETPELVAVNDQLGDESQFVADELLPAEALDDDGPYAPEPEIVADTPPSRYTVYSARYRHTLKGIDRGKWEVSVTEEADAPLLTVDAVVRGVQRRSGDLDETVRLSGPEFRAAISA